MYRSMCTQSDLAYLRAQMDEIAGAVLVSGKNRQPSEIHTSSIGEVAGVNRVITMRID
jgi:hypothetical protein